MKKAKRFLTCLLCFALVFVMGGGGIFSAFSLTASAATVTYYSTVIDDLKKDHTFDRSAYPDNATDYSLDVIQIAEGDRGELYLYAYQPSNATKDLRANYINMSLQSNAERERSYKLYSLTWLSSDGTLDKYLVNDVTVSDAVCRYYNIASIYRPFDASIDKPAEEADDVDNAIAYPVATCFAAYYYNNALIYEAEKTDVVDIEILAVGSVRYNEGFKLYVDKCDSHFVAFKVENYDVDRIYDATITYVIQDYRHNTYIGGESEEYGDPIRVTKDITEMETGSNEGGFLAHKYTWNRIVTKDEFNKQLEDFKNEEVIFSKGGLNDAEFVFQFLETSYSATAGSLGSVYESSKRVTEVGILRLHFLSGKKTYNLGVVSDLVSDDGKPDFVITVEDDLENLKEKIEEFFQAILRILGFLVFVAIAIFLWGVLKPFVKPVLDFIWKGIKILLGWILSALFYPVRLFGRLIRRLFRQK